MKSRLKDIANNHLSGITPLLEKIILVQKKGKPFKKYALYLLMQAEETIPGAGMHYSIIKGNHYCYPADYKFERVVRPLRYSLNTMGSAYTGFSSTRYSVDASGGHLEGCMKTLLGWPRNRKPLGVLIKTKKSRQQLGKELTEYVSELTDLAINPAKHEYVSDGSLKPVFQFADALYVHFLARRFGAIILKKAGVLDCIEVLKPIPGQRVRCFPGAKLLVSHDKS